MHMGGEGFQVAVSSGFLRLGALQCSVARVYSVQAKLLERKIKQCCVLWFSKMATVEL
jgi:hypothetical protein